MKALHIPLATRVVSALSVAAIGAAAPAWAQSDLADQSTAPASIPLDVDLTIPVLEERPVGGWPYVGDPLAVERQGASRSLPTQREDEGPAPDFVSSLSIRDLMTEPFLMEPGDGRVWARTRDMRASFGPEGFVAYPVFGSRSAQEWPVRFDVASVTLGGEPLDAGMDGMPVLDAQRVSIPRRDLTEVYHVGLDTVEQTFVFETLPRGGDLVVRLDVETELEPDYNGGSLRFLHDEFGGVSYGAAYVVDADGRRQAIERRWTDEQIVLTVPAGLLANATLPITIDPPINTRTNGFGADDDSHPDVTYAGRAGRYFICWQEYTSTTNADVYMVNVSGGGGGSQGTELAIDITNDYWATPRVAYTGAGPRLLIVASRTSNGPGTGVGSIVGQMANPSTNSLVGSSFFISSTGTYKVDPDVGGTNRTSPVNAHFLVAWTRLTSTTMHTLEYRVIDWSGSSITPVNEANGSASIQNRKVAISESHGDAGLPGDWWTMSWIRDGNSDGLGEVWARRVIWDGNFTFGTGNFQVGTDTTAASVSVTSRLDEPILGTGDRPSIIAVERWRSLFGGWERNIDAYVVTDGQSYSRNSISSSMEDFDGSLNQRQPSIGTDGDCFMLSYTENYWGVTSIDNDMYMLSGHIATTGNDAYLALAERHQMMAGTGFDDMNGRLAMFRDGDATFDLDDGFCVWTRVLTGERGELRGYTLDCATNSTAPFRSVGQQYCRANSHIGGLFTGGRRNSWLWILGDQSLSTPHFATVIDMPLNTFGYLICSQTPADINMPGGSQGRLCLGGSIGRYITQVASSGLTGGFETTILPSILPQPTGSTAANPGETWFFQVWHRDVSGGQATSNFSNACSVTFL